MSKEKRFGKNNQFYININHSHIYNFCKRLIDILIALFFLIVSSPFLLIISLAIKIDDFNAPIFYTQNRVGLNGKIFRIYKFRSMYVNADKYKKQLLDYNEVDGAMFKMHDDPRVTKIGHFLRKHSIDELPQLLNVLKGDMALVGPRPPLISEVKSYTDYDKLRLRVVPGCTGLWQVSGRNALDFEEMVQLDINYINHASIRLDFIICLKTIWIMIAPNNAY